MSGKIRLPERASLPLISSPLLCCHFFAASKKKFCNKSTPRLIQEFSRSVSEPIFYWFAEYLPVDFLMKAS